MNRMNRRELIKGFVGLAAMLGIKWDHQTEPLPARPQGDRPNVFDVVCERDITVSLGDDGYGTSRPGAMKVSGRARLDTRAAYRLYAEREAKIIGPSRIGMDVSVVGLSHGEAPALVEVEWVMSAAPDNWDPWLMDGMSGTLQMVPRG